MYGRHLRTPLEQVLPTPQECPRSAQSYVAGLFPILENARTVVQQILQERKFTMQERCTMKAKNCQFQVGDTIYPHSPVLAQDKSKKQARPWHGPYYIVEKQSHHHVRLRAVSSNAPMPHPVHVDRLKHTTLRHMEVPASKTQGDTKTQVETHVSDNTISGDKQSVPQVTMSDPQNTSTPKVDQSQIVNDQGPESAFYEVEKILYKRRRQDHWQYRVKWLSYPPSANSWVDYDDLSPSCQRFVKATHNSIPIYKKYRR